MDMVQVSLSATQNCWACSSMPGGGMRGCKIYIGMGFFINIIAAL